MELIIDNKEDVKYLHRKSGKVYTMLCTCTNCTNAQDGQVMIMYMNDDEGKLFVREKSEFMEKFIKLE